MYPIIQKLKSGIHRSTFIVLCFFFTLTHIVSAQNDAISRFFDQYMNNEDFDVVYVTPKMLQMLAKLDIHDPDFQAVKGTLANLKALRVLSTNNNAMKYYNEAESKIPTNEYELLLMAREKNEKVKFWTKESNDTISELLMLVGEPTEFTLISFTGNINLNELSKLYNKLDVHGLRHLKDLDNTDKSGSKYKNKN